MWVKLKNETKNRALLNTFLRHDMRTRCHEERVKQMRVLMVILAPASNPDIRENNFVSMSSVIHESLSSL